MIYVVVFVTGDAQDHKIFADQDSQKIDTAIRMWITTNFNMKAANTNQLIYDFLEKYGWHMYTKGWE